MQGVLDRAAPPSPPPRGRTELRSASRSSGSSSTSGGLTTTCSSLVGIGWPTASNGLAASPSAFYLSTLVAVIVGVATVASVLGWLWLDRNRKPARQTA